MIKKMFSDKLYEYTAQTSEIWSSLPVPSHLLPLSLTPKLKTLPYFIHKLKTKSLEDTKHNRLPLDLDSDYLSTSVFRYLPPPVHAPVTLEYHRPANSLYCLSPQVRPLHMLHSDLSFLLYLEQKTFDAFWLTASKPSSHVRTNFTLWVLSGNKRCFLDRSGKTQYSICQLPWYLRNG